LNNLSSNLLAQIFGQSSSDPFLMLVTISHSTFPTIYLANNTVDIVSRGITFSAFPMQVTLPSDDGETTREVRLELDNVSLALIEEFRKITTPPDVKVEMLLASDPNTIQLSIEELKLRNISYNKSRISARLFMDSFLNVEMTSEKYDPAIFPGLF
jgi:hypothetical protein